eukprot:172415_1
MAALESILLPETEDDINNNKRRYKVTFNHEVEVAGFSAIKTRIVSANTEFARDIFIPESNIIQINNTKIAKDTPSEQIGDSIRYCKNHPASFMILECSTDMFTKGTHFQLNLKFIVKQFTSVPLEQLTCPKLSKIISTICNNKKVEIYDIIWSQHFTGLIIFGFIYDPSYQCKNMLYNIMNQFDKYTTLRTEIINMFQKTLVSRSDISQQSNESKKYTTFRWNISQIKALAQCFEKTGLVGSQESVLEKFWEMHLSNIIDKGIHKDDTKGILRELVRFSMGCYVAWVFQDNETMTINTYYYQQELWLEMITDWLYNNITVIRAITYQDFKDNYSKYLQQFYDEIVDKQCVQNVEIEDKNINFVVYGYMRRFIHELNMIIPEDIMGLVNVYFCDLSIHVWLQQYCFSDKYKKLNWGLERYSIKKFVHVLTTTESNSWIAMLTCPQTEGEFVKIITSEKRGKVSDLQKSVAIVIARGVCKDDNKKIPVEALKDLNEKFLIQYE